MPVIGFLSSASPDGFGSLVEAFSQGLRDTGFFDNQNVKLEYRWAEGHYDRLPALAADLVQRRVAAIAATGSPNSAQVAKTATDTIPIVFANGGDPVADGVVASLNRPGGNITGVTFFSNVLAKKRLGLLRELIPTAAVIAVLINPSNARAKTDTREMQEAAHAIGQTIVVLDASSEREIDLAFSALAQHHASALLINADGFFRTQSTKLVTLAAHHSVPAVYSDRHNALVGGLMSYGTSIEDAYRQSGVYVGQILNGAKPANLPVIQSVKFELVINLKTAKALGIEVPPTLLALADEVIE
jgi:putative ABC transport system substrate-binding protein